MEYFHPHVSVCIPTYNSEEFIGEAIESVLRQTMADFELIVIDDGSTDHTLAKASAYGDDPRIRVFSNETNMGMEGNWNRVLSEAGGRYIKVLCDDDRLHPECLERQAAVLDDPAHEGIALVCSDRRIIDSKGRTILTRGFPGKRGRVNGREAVRRCIRAGTNLIGEPSAVLFRAEIINKIGKFDGTIPYMIDLDYWFRALLHGDLYVIGSVLCDFRVSSESTSVQTVNSQFGDVRKFIDKYIGHPAITGVSSVDRKIGLLNAFKACSLRHVLYRLLLHTASCRQRFGN